MYGYYSTVYSIVYLPTYSIVEAGSRVGRLDMSHIPTYPVQTDGARGVSYVRTYQE